jgi:5-methylcytosine-specific restriction endonuclease McrA
MRYMSKVFRQKVYEKTNGRCAYCGDELNGVFQVDHIIAKRIFENSVHNKFKIPSFLQHLTIYDVNHIDNLLASCRVCNKWKDTHHLELFRSELQQQIKRLNDYSTNYRIAKKYGLVQETPNTILFYFETLKPQKCTTA